MYGLPPDEEELYLVVEKILDRIYSSAIPILRNELNRQGIRLTDNLYSSISKSVNKRYQEKVIEHVISMDLTGVFQDYRTTRYSGMPPFSNSEGTGWFDYALAGYQKNGGFKMGGVVPYSTLPAYALKSTEATVRYISAGAIMNIKKNPTVTKPSARSNWFKVYFSQIINKSTDEITQWSAEFSAAKSAEIIADTLTERQK